MRYDERKRKRAQRGRDDRERKRNNLAKRRRMRKRCRWREEGSKGRWRKRWRGCGRSDKERLHCRVITAIHFVLLCVFFVVHNVVPVGSALYSHQQGD